MVIARKHDRMFASMHGIYVCIKMLMYYTSPYLQNFWLVVVHVNIVSLATWQMEVEEMVVHRVMAQCVDGDCLAGKAKPTSTCN